MNTLVYNSHLQALPLPVSLPLLELASLLPAVAILTPLPLLTIPVFPAELTDDFLTSNNEFLTSDGDPLSW